jgi:hypothetical protein
MELQEMLDGISVKEAERLKKDQTIAEQAWEIISGTKTSIKNIRKQTCFRRNIQRDIEFKREKQILSFENREIRWNEV